MDVMTVTEAAKATGLTRMTLWNYRAAGLLPSKARGRNVLVSVPDVQAAHRVRLANNPAHQYRLRRAREQGVILV